MKTQITFEQYLTQQGHTRQTIKSYTYETGFFLQSNPKADQYTYKDILDYFAGEGSQYKNRNYRTTILASIKRYYDYPVEIGKRNDHPCRRLFFKRGKRSSQVILNDLFSSEELEQLMNREERYPELKLKNQVIISLLIYQGLTPGEIAGLKVSNIDSDAGSVFLKGNKKLSRRHLELIPKQYRIFDRYLHESRPKLKQKGLKTDALILGKLGTPITVDDVNYLIETAKPLFSDRNLNPKTIRASVIANWLNEKKIPLEQAQLLAGHKWISTTVAYRHTSVDKQREMINKFHPLG
jgi:integrase/recombinase XerD